LTNLANRGSFGFMQHGTQHSYSIGEAKTQLSKLVALVERGEVVELRRDKMPVARLIPVPPVGAVRTPGALRGGVTMADDFDVWPDDVARALGLHG
jgi:antitoxin (DNA-binding transcriptional repressor) of toxin-antitoxin stability system